MNAVWHDHATSDLDLGDEPPLLTADLRSGPPNRRRVSIRWLTGTVLAAMASTSLMGGALYVAFDGRQSMAMPVAVDGVLRDGALAALDGEAIPRGDRIEPETGPAPSRQILRVSTIMKDGERDLVRVRPFARVSAPLVSNATDVVDAIPAFDPLRIFAEANVDTVDGMPDTLYGADVDGQMTLKVTDFPVEDATLRPERPVDLATVEASVREAAQFLDGTNVEVAALPLVDPTRFDFGFAPQDGFEQYGVRIVPENVSFVAASAEAFGTEPGSYSEEKIVTVGEEEDLASILTSNEATDEEAGEIVVRFRSDFRLLTVETGDRLRIVLAPAGDESGRYQPVRVSLYRDGTHIGTVALTDHQGYVPTDEPRLDNEDLLQATGTVEVSDKPRPRLYESLYQTALANGMSATLIDELVRIFSFDLDFNARVAPGDKIEVVYSLDEDESERRDVTEIVYTSITLAGKTRRYYRYRAPDDGSIDYYDDQGNSAKKFLLRKPMSGGTFRSGFGSRSHPLLGYVRMHNGVDWAAPTGTPIMAAGDGVVAYADWKSGYGNFITIRHNNGYETAYAHQTRFAAGIREGVRVRQGQIIGYVGSTGLSTGPHLHYEVMVNGSHVDPMRIKLPKGRTLEGSVLATFETERDRIDTLLGVGAPSKLAAADVTGGG